MKKHDCNIKSSLTAFALFTGLAINAQANSDITWSTPQTISGASDVSTLGTTLYAFTAYGGAQQTVNGVPFQYIASFTFDSVYGGLPSAGTPDASYNTALSGFHYNNVHNNNFAYTHDSDFAGLKVGHTYQIEFWLSDTRNLGFTRGEYLSGGADTYGTDTSAEVLYPADGTSAGQYITGTFTADSTFELVAFTPVASINGDAAGQLNMYQVRDITSAPEPTTLALVGVGSLALLFRKRK